MTVTVLCGLLLVDLTAIAVAVIVQVVPAATQVEPGATVEADITVDGVGASCLAAAPPIATISISFAPECGFPRTGQWTSTMQVQVGADTPPSDYSVRIAEYDPEGNVVDTFLWRLVVVGTSTTTTTAPSTTTTTTTMPTTTSLPPTTVTVPPPTTVTVPPPTTVTVPPPTTVTVPPPTTSQPTTTTLPTTTTAVPSTTTTTTVPPTATTTAPPSTTTTVLAATTSTTIPVPEEFDAPILFTTPDAMRPQETTTIELVINPRDSDEPLPPVTSPGGQTTETITTTCSTTAQLTGPPDVFAIAAATEPTQGLCRGDTGRWLWSVTALRSGHHQLQLTISANYPTEPPQTREVFSQQIVIQVGLLTRLTSPVTRNVEFVAATVLAGVLTGIGRRMWNQRVRTGVHRQAAGSRIGDATDGGEPHDSAPTANEADDSSEE